MADEYTDVATVEELLLFCVGWKINHLLEHFISSFEERRCRIYLFYIDWLKKNVQCCKLVGLGLDGAAMFAGKKI